MRILLLVYSRLCYKRVIYVLYYRGISEAKLWKSPRLVAQGLNKESEDGLHISKNGLYLVGKRILGR